MKRLTRSEKRRKSGNPSRTNCARSIAQHTASCHRERERERERERVKSLKLGPKCLLTLHQCSFRGRVEVYASKIFGSIAKLFYFIFFLRNNS